MPPRPYRAMTCRGRELNYGSHTYFFDHTRSWRASPDEWSAQCWGQRQHKHERQYTPSTHSVIPTRRIWNDDYDGQMILWGLKVPDICLTGEEKTSPRKLVPTGDRTRARCVTSAHATTCSTAVDQDCYNKINKNCRSNNKPSPEDWSRFNSWNVTWNEKHFRQWIPSDEFMLEILRLV